MKKKRLAAVAVAFVLVLSLSASVLALNGISIGDFIGLVDSVDIGAFPSYNETSWISLSIDERRSALEDATIAIKGTPHFDNDFLNSSQALDYYQYLIKSGNSVNFVTAPVQSMYGAIMLERASQADFGLGFYNDNGHSSGNFGDNTVADTLNSDFLDYIQKVPYSGVSPSTAYRFSNGYYVDWEPLYIGYAAPTPCFNVNGTIHTPIKYGLRFYLHNETGEIIDMVDHKGYNSYTPLLVCDVCGGGFFNNFTITSDGYYYFDYFAWKSPHPTSYVAEKSATYAFPWWSLYGAPTEDIINYDPVAVGTDENGNQIQLNINSDGVTYEGSTYNYNSDNSVTINGNTYYLTVKPDSVNDDYYNDFLSDTINNYYYYYTTNEKPFDGTDIISSLKSIFSSLEAFRGDFFTKFKQLFNELTDGFNDLRKSLNNLGKKLDLIIQQLKTVNKQLEDISEEQEEENKLAWLDLISQFKSKVGWSSLDKSMSNISTAFFGTREYTVSETGELDVSIISSDNTRVASSMPSLTVDYMGTEYNLYTCVSSLGSGIDTIKAFISLFLWVGFIVSVYRSIPSIIGGVASVTDHSNNIVIDKNTGEVKRGA